MGSLSALTMRAARSPVLVTISLPELLGYFGLAAAAVLGLRVVAAIVRDGTL